MSDITLCKDCGQPLIESGGFSGGYYHLCDNHNCNSFRERQGIRIKENGSSAPAYIRPWRDPEYQEAYNERRRINYQVLRNLGIPSREASSMTSDKQTRLALAWKAEN